MDYQEKIKRTIAEKTEYLTKRHQIIVEGL